MIRDSAEFNVAAVTLPVQIAADTGLWSALTCLIVMKTESSLTRDFEKFRREKDVM
jgi:hypothetical protein